MKIAIDGRGAFHYRGTGIGTYTWRLIDALEHGMYFDTPEIICVSSFTVKSIAGLPIKINLPRFLIMAAIYGETIFWIMRYIRRE